MNLPAPVVTTEPRGACLTNMHACAALLGRPVEHLARFIAWRVGCSVVIYPDHFAVAAPLAPAAGQELVTHYIEMCVRCPQCKSVGDSPTCCGQPRPDPVPPTTHVVEVLE